MTTRRFTLTTIQRVLQVVILGGMLLVAGAASAAVLVDEDFEGGLPGDWTEVDNGGNVTFSQTTGHNGTGGTSGFAGRVGDDISASGTRPAGWAQPNVTFDGSSDWTLTADIRIDDEASRDEGLIFVGDLASQKYYATYM